MKLDGQPTANIIEDNQVVDMKSLIIGFLLQATIKMRDGMYLAQPSIYNVP